MPELSIADLDLTVLNELFHDQRDLGERDLFTLRLLTNEQGATGADSGGGFARRQRAGKTFSRRLGAMPDALSGGIKRIFSITSNCTTHCRRRSKASYCFSKNTPCAGPTFPQSGAKTNGAFPLGFCARWSLTRWFTPIIRRRGDPFGWLFLTDRIEVENPGILLPGLTLDDIRQGLSKIRNHVHCTGLSRTEPD